MIRKLKKTAYVIACVGAGCALLLAVEKMASHALLNHIGKYTRAHHKNLIQKDER